MRFVQKRHDRGSALIVSMILMIVLAVVGVALVNRTTREVDAVASKRHWDRSMSCVEGAREMLLSQFRTYGVNLVNLSTLLARPASGATDNVCWNRDTERMDFYTNPPTRGDNNFFSFTVSGTANVTMIYPSTASMKSLPMSLYELRESAVQGTQTLLSPLRQGCQNAYLNNPDYFLPTTPHPPPASPASSGSYA